MIMAAQKTIRLFEGTPSLDRMLEKCIFRFVPKEHALWAKGVEGKCGKEDER